MILTGPTISHSQDGLCCFSADLSSHGKTQRITFYIEKEYEKYLCVPNLDPFVVASLIPAMQSGEGLYIQGRMSEKLYYNIDNYVLHLLNILEPSLSKIRIHAEHLNSDLLPSSFRGVGTGFSGGIDSFCVIADHFFGSSPTGFHLTHLALNNVGSHGSGGRALFKERYNRLLPAAEEMALPFVKIDSNFDEFLQISFQQTVTIRNAAAILILQPLFRRYLVASSFQYKDCHISATYDSSYFDPALLHLFSTETTEFVTAGSQYSRVEKTKKVTSVALSARHLDVCSDPNAHGNCSVCFKCARTIYTLELLGKASAYSDVFNLERFAQCRNDYLGSLILSRDPFALEIKEWMRRNSSHFPKTAYLRAAGKRVPSPVRRFIRKLIPKRKP